MKKINLTLLLLTCFLASYQLSFSQNVSMDFDGNGDFILTPLPLGNSSFTVEAWFLSSDNSINQSCSGNFRRLFSFSGPTTRFEIGTCGGIMNIYWFDTGGNSFSPIAISNQNFNNNTWHHIEVVRKNQDVYVYIDCVLEWSGIVTASFNIASFHLAHWVGGLTPTQDWLGQIDDVRVWNFARDVVNDCQKTCMLNGSEAGLQLYWNFDEGTPNGNNIGTTLVLDSSPNGNNGTFYTGATSFALTGNTSNFVNSNAPLAYPNLNNLSFEIKDYPYQNNLLTEICNNDPAHFRLLQNGAVPGPFSNVNVQWYYDDGAGGVQIASPPFSDFSFGVPQGNITYDCATSTDGFVDRKYYAISSVTEPISGDICDYKTDEYDLRICCPISPATVSITPADPLCEGETVSVNVCLNSPDLFIQTPGQYVSIEWYYDGTYIGNTNQTCFNYNITAPIVTSPQQLCFEAMVKNCNNKSANFKACLTVDPEPVCGDIIGWPDPNPLNITLVATSPHLIYEICPDNDAIVAIDPANPFLDCIPQWQYSFNGTTGWVDMGLSNSVQNTNVLPTAQWTSNSIFYRIKCNPLSNPSGCDPCFSDPLEIRLKTPPIANAITGTNQLCKGQQNILTVATPNTAHTYTWFCDGLQVGTGTSYSYTASQSACYWIESTDGCYVVESPQYCVDVCEVVAIMTCPLPPNDCACLGDLITLSACDSYSTCRNANLQFTWYIDGVAQTTTACSITPRPAASGTTYRVEVVDLTTGCSDATEQTVVPCDKSN